MPFPRGPATSHAALSIRLVVTLPFLLLFVASSSSAKPPLAAAKDATPEAIQKAVLRVEVSIVRRDWTAPWKPLAPESASASAFVIAGDRLLTNAHVVRDAQQITVKKNDGSAPALAAVEVVDDDCDLAVLKLPDKSLLAGLRPLKLGELPAVGSSVTTYGYPVGGRELSTTAGVVSRIEAVLYGWGLASHLAGQTDAAINPGNSGGPVVQDGLVVGVAFQMLQQGQNIGFFIPAPVVRHFLDDVADGHYAGFADVPARFSSLQSPAMRRERALPADRSGVVVEDIPTGSDLKGVLAPGDILLSVDGERISDDGTFASGATRLPFMHLLDMKSLGQVVHFEIWRDGKATKASWTASRYAPWERLRKARGGRRYLVFGGLVFVPVDIEFLATVKPTDRREAIYRALTEPLWGEAKDVDKELVLLVNVLRDPVNEGVSDATSRIVRRVNGQPVRDLADLARILDGSSAKRDVFELGLHGVYLEAIDHERASATRAALLASQGIGHDRNL